MYPIPNHLVDQYFATIVGVYPFWTDIFWSRDEGQAWHLIPDAKGTVTCDRTSQTRWSAKIRCSNETVNFDDERGLNPYDSQVKIIRNIVLPGGFVFEVPWGIYRVDEVKDLGHVYDLELYSFERAIQDSRFPRPRTLKNYTVEKLVELLVKEAVPDNISVDWRISSAIRSTILPIITEERDRWALLDGSGDKPSIANSFGLEMYMNGDGRFVVTPVPTIEDPTRYDFGPAERGVVVSSTITKSRKRMFNFVIVTGEREIRVMTNEKSYKDYLEGLERDRVEHARLLASNPQHQLRQREKVAPNYKVEKQAIGPFYVWDKEPSSRTYAGPDPVGRPQDASAFGVVPRFFHSPMIGDEVDAVRAGRAILENSLGLLHTANFTAVSNPVIEAGDVVEMDGVPYTLDKWSCATDSVWMNYDTRSTRVTDVDQYYEDLEVVEDAPPSQSAG